MNKHAGICGLCLPPLNVEQCGPEFLAHGSLTLAHRIGVAIHNSRVQHADPVTKILSLLGGKLLFSGVIIGNDKTEKRGFSCGTLRIKDPHNPQAGEMKITYINENITAQLGNQYVATSPDCISVVDSSSGEGIFCSQYKYGVRVAATVSLFSFKKSQYWDFIHCGFYFISFFEFRKTCGFKYFSYM